MNRLLEPLGLAALDWAHPAALLALLAVPLGVLALRRRRGALAALIVPSTRTLGALRRSPWVRLWWLPSALLLGALACTAVGLAGPRVRSAQRRDLSVEGIDIVIALDLSTSMLAADFRPKDRITVAKDVLKNFISSRQNDRLGLVVFASEAYTQCPLTLDYRVLLALLDQVRTGVIVDGTAIGNALATAVNRLRDSDAKSRVIILLTDGDNNAGNISPLQAAQLARQMGVKVFTILIGRGGRVSYPTGTDLFGRPVYEPVVIDVNPELLQQISKETGGVSYTSTDKASLESGLRQVLDSLEKSKIDDATGSPQYDDLSARPFLLAAALVALALALRATRLGGAP